MILYLRPRVDYFPQRPVEMLLNDRSFKQILLSTSFTSSSHCRDVPAELGWRRRVPGHLDQVDWSLIIILKKMVKLWVHTDHDRRVKRMTVSILAIRMSSLIRRAYELIDQWLLDRSAALSVRSFVQRLPVGSLKSHTPRPLILVRATKHPMNKSWIPMHLPILCRWRINELLCLMNFTFCFVSSPYFVNSALFFPGTLTVFRCVENIQNNTGMKMLNSDTLV